jgi:sugar O-acyltransferase (sialic acid O-acetyltransferase NeuD family)
MAKTMAVTKIMLWGAGASAREIAWLAEDGQSPTGERFKVVCLVDDDEARSGTEVHGLPVLTLKRAVAAHPSAPLVLAIGDSAARARMAAAATQRGLPFRSLIHRTVLLSPFAAIGTGVTIAANCIISVEASIGDHAQLNFGCTVSHDSIIGRFTTLACGVHISGRVRIGEQVTIGVNAAIINGSQAELLVIGDGAVIGAGACVIAPVAAGETVVGVPARPVKR